MVRAAVFEAPGRPVAIRSFPEPELEPDSALLAVECSEICGTDVHLQDGRLAGVPYPIIPGHVTVGRLARIRGRLVDVEGRAFAEGDRVTFLDVHGTCQRCWYCLVAKASTRCPARRVYGITYGIADGLTGGWAEALYVKPGTRCIRLDDVEPEAFMAAGCALPTGLHAIERADLRMGDTVLVLGSGPVGLTLVILARRRGAGRVLCIGAPRARLDAGRALGANDVADFRDLDADAQTAWVRERTGGRGADLTFEASGDPRAVRQAMRATRDAGCVVVAGQYTDHGDVAINPHADLNRKHLDVRGCWGSDFSHFHRAAALLRDPALQAAWSPLRPQRFGLTQLDTALQQIRTGEIVKALVDPHLA